METHEKLFLIRWRAHCPEDELQHRFLLFASDAELALTIADEILRSRGRVCGVEEFA